MLEIPDYAAYLKSGQGLVPDYAAEQERKANLDVQQQQERRLQIQQQQERQKAAQEREREIAFRAATEKVMLDPKPDAVARLAIQFPEKAEELKKGWDLMDASKKQVELQQMGEVYGAALNGKYDIAAATMRKRVEADRAAGMADPVDDAILSALESGDPVQQKAALGQISIGLAMISGPEKFSQAVKDLNGDKTPLQKNAEYAESLGVGTAADFVRNETDEIVSIPLPGGRTYVGPRSGLTGIGGGQSSGVGAGPNPASIPATGAAIEANALQIVPGLTVTSRKRSAAKNKAVGGKGNSFHLTDQARDFVPPKGMSVSELAAKLRPAFAGFDVIDEGDHVHVEPSSRGPVRVKTIQQANALKPGTIYITPDGRTMKR